MAAGTDDSGGGRDVLPVNAADPYSAAREAMVASQIEARGVRDAAVLEAMRRVPRHEFVDAGVVESAYSDGPLPIACGQTISQPYIVAYMTAMLELKPAHRVLEIGTGCGYQAAVLSCLAARVVSVEIVAELAAAARGRLARLGYANVEVVCADGYHGWPAEAPYDAVIVTSAAETVPPPLIEQLRPGGRMIIPVGPQGWNQELVMIRKLADGSVTRHQDLPVSFVPFTRRRG